MSGELLGVLVLAVTQVVQAVWLIRLSRRRAHPLTPPPPYPLPPTPGGPHPVTPPATPAGGWTWCPDCPGPDVPHEHGAGPPPDFITGRDTN